MVMAVMMTTTMTGCGKSDDKLTVSVGTPSGQSTTNSSQNSEMETKTLSQVLNENEYTIWYATDVVDKSRQPNAIWILYKDGTYLCYSAIDKKFGELAQMTDEDIETYVIEKVKSFKESQLEASLKDEYKQTAQQLGYWFYGDYYATQDRDNLVMELKSNVEDWVYRHEESDPKEYVDGFLLDWLGEHQEAMACFDGQAELDWDALADAYIAAASAVCDGVLEEVKNSETAGTDADIEKGKYYLSIWTDATGNNVKEETVTFQKPDNSFDLSANLNGILGAQQIYDSYYNGYSKRDGRKMWVMRVDSATRFRLDEIGTEGITVDCLSDKIAEYSGDAADDSIVGVN